MQISDLEFWAFFRRILFDGNILWKSGGIVDEKYLVENIQWKHVSGKYLVEREGTS